MNSFDGFGQQRCHRKLNQVRQQLLARHWNRVGDGDRINRSVAQSFDGGAAQNAVSASDVNLFRTRFVNQACRTADRSGRADHVVEHESHFAFDGAADDRVLADFQGVGTTFVDDGQIATESFGVAESSFDTAFVGTDDDDFIAGESAADEVIVDDWSGVQVIDGNVEETLDLCGVQIHGEDAIGAGSSDQVRNQFRGDWHAPFVFAILSCVAKVWNHGGDPLGTGTLAAIDHRQQLNQVVVDGRASRLHQEDVATANIFVEFAVVFAVRKLAQRDAGGFQVQVATQFVSEVVVCSATENFQFTHNPSLALFGRPLGVPRGC